MILSKNLVKSFARPKGASSRVATRSVYRPEDRRNNVDVVFRAGREHKIKDFHRSKRSKHEKFLKNLHDHFLVRKDLSDLQDAFPVKKDLQDYAPSSQKHVDWSAIVVFRASDRLDRLALPFSTPYKAGARVYLVDTNIDTYLDTHTQWNDHSTASSSRGAVSGSPSEHANTGVKPSEPNTAHANTGVKKSSRRTRTEKEQTTSLAVDSPSKKQLKQQKAEAEAQKANRAGLRDSPPQSESVPESSRASQTCLNAQQTSKETQEEPKLVLTSIRPQPNGYVQVRIMPLPSSSKPDRVLQASKIGDCSSPEGTSVAANQKNKKAVQQAKLAKADLTGTKQNKKDAQQAKLAKTESTSTNRKKKALRRENKSKAESTAHLTPSAKATASKRSTDSSHYMVVEPSPLSNRGGFSAPSSTSINATFSFFLVAPFLLMMLLKNLSNKKG